MAIVMHAGMPKAGSSTIQGWLQDEAAALRDRGITVVVARPGPSEDVVIAPYERGGINSGWVVASVARRASAEERARAIEQFTDALAAAADRYGDVVISGEFLGHAFWALHDDTLACLQNLSARHELRVAYYVRPQHTALEAWWREFGWHARIAPSAFVEQRAAWLRYASARSGVRALAPGIDFEPRPLSRDRLDRGDLIGDFAGRFLDMEASETGGWSNLGLPLEVVVLLRAAPPGLFAQGRRLTEHVDRIKQLLAGEELPGDERMELSRRILRKFAHETFATENHQLGWEDFVPAPQAGDDDLPGLGALDSLWAPAASEAELAFLFRLLRTVV